MDKQQESVVQKQQIQKQQEVTTQKQQIKAQQIIKQEIIPQRVNDSVQMKSKKSVYVSDFNWGLNQFDQQAALKRFSILGNLSLPFDHYQEQKINLGIVDSATKVSGLTKIVTYIIRGQDPKRQKIQIVRKPADILALRTALAKRWPGIIIPPIPDKYAVGVTESQIVKNKLRFFNNFLIRLCKNQAIYYGQEMQIFLTGQQATIQKTLLNLKPIKAQELLKLYIEKFPLMFEEKSQKFLQQSEQKIRDFQIYFTQHKTDLGYLKSQAKRTSQLRDKLIKQRYKVLNKLIPSYEQTCLSWFQTTKPITPARSSLKQEVRSSSKQETRLSLKQEVKVEGDYKIYASDRYKSILQSYRQELFFQEGKNSIWQIFQILKFELKEIEAAIQAITEYKLLNKDRKYYLRNLENNKQQIQDINNNKTTFKIFFLSGSTDEKKTQLANETQNFQSELKIREQLWMGVTQLMIMQLKQFYQQRLNYYKYNLRKSLRTQSVYMGKLFNLYVQAQRL